MQSEITLMSFKEALQKSGKAGRYLLLGNGFSRAYNSCFDYKSLFNKANFNEHLKDVFSELKTQDFERVIRSLETASNILKYYGDKSSSLIKDLEGDAKLIRDLLVKTISKVHPEGGQKLHDEEAEGCLCFLRNFKKIYTLNYDILLYWVLMEGLKHRKSNNNGFIGGISDGFINHTFSLDSSPNFFFLHGGLHLFESGADTKKLVWGNGQPIIEQVSEAIIKRQYPLFVAEGSSEQKWLKIRRNTYLAYGWKSFERVCKSSDIDLFVFGHSLGSEDEHFLSMIRDGEISRVFISVYKGDDEYYDKDFINQAKELAGRRSARHPLEVTMFDAASANVWGEEKNNEP